MTRVLLGFALAWTLASAVFLANEARRDVDEAPTVLAGGSEGQRIPLPPTTSSSSPSTTSLPPATTTTTEAAVPRATSPPPTLLERRTLVSTAYCEVGTTASGTQTGPGQAASNLFAFGTRVRIVGFGTVTITDRSAAGATELDVWLADCDTARRWGRRAVQAEVVG